MPDQIIYRGVNSQGNRYDCRVDTSTGDRGYHYSNADGSFTYQNTNGSKYFDSGTGYKQYTSPSGEITRSYSDSQSAKK